MSRYLYKDIDITVCTVVCNHKLVEKTRHNSCSSMQLCPMYQADPKLHIIVTICLHVHKTAHWLPTLKKTLSHISGVVLSSCTSHKFCTGGVFGEYLCGIQPNFTPHHPCWSDHPACHTRWDQPWCHFLQAIGQLYLTSSVAKAVTLLHHKQHILASKEHCLFRQCTFLQRL